MYVKYYFHVILVLLLLLLLLLKIAAEHVLNQSQQSLVNVTFIRLHEKTSSVYVSDPMYVKLFPCVVLTLSLKIAAACVAFAR